MFEGLARFAYRRRWWVIGVWLVVLPIAGFLSYLEPSALGPGDFTIKGSESYNAAVILGKQFHQDSMKDSIVILRSRTLDIHSAGFAAAVTRVIRAIRADSALQATFIDNPLVSGNSQLIARKQHGMAHGLALLVTSRLKEADLEKQIDHLRSVIQTPGFITYVTGVAATNHDFNGASQKDIQSGDSITVPILLIVLLLVFGSVVGAGIPVVQALFSIPVSLAGVFIFAHFIDTSIYATNVVEVLGLGISVDYSLFITYRFREELTAAGGDRETAIVRTMTTTGRAVFFSGITVAIGLGALLLSGVEFMQSLGLAGILVPVSALLTAMTLLPAVLSVLGTKINRLRVLPARFLTTGEKGGWHRLANFIMERPWVTGGIALVIVVLAVLPVRDLAYSYGSLKNAPRDLQSIQGYVYMKNNFPIVPDPTLVLIQAPPGHTVLEPAQLAGITSLERHIRQIPGVREVVGPAEFVHPGDTLASGRVTAITGRYIAQGGRTGLLFVVPTGGVGSHESATVVARSRDLSRAMMSGALRGDTIDVGGSEAGYVDWDNVVLSRFPYVILFVLILTYCFLFFAFRSVFLPLKAVVLNLLSVGAAYGLMQLVFQRGVGLGILGFSPEAGIATWVPVFLFAFLFGLSMDYEVFLLSRIREGWLGTRNNRESVAFGLEKTGRLITSAALIMVIAFSGFLLGSQVQLAEFGFGLMISIAVDASIIRIFLVPSIMEIMGNLNWWVPNRLRAWSSRGSAAEAGNSALAAGE